MDDPDGYPLYLSFDLLYHGLEIIYRWTAYSRPVDAEEKIEAKGMTEVRTGTVSGWRSASVCRRTVDLVSVWND